MPELPEVETIRRGLQLKLPGRRIEQVEVRKDNVLLTPCDELERRLNGQVIGQVDRRGKYLLVHCERETLIVHLGMTGQFTYWDRNAPDARGFDRHPTTGLQRTRQHGVDKHTHLTFWLDGGDGVHYRDTRMFGNIRVLARDQVFDIDPLASLGPEPLGPDYTLEAFDAGLKGRKTPVKARLLDQRFVAGVGNIYADEALFRAGLRPGWRAGGLTRAERRRLFDAVPVVLEQGIHFGGTSMRDYIDSDGERGSNQEELWVYGREGEPCRVCGTPIRRIVVAQRSSHYCPTCQSRGSKRTGAKRGEGT